MAINKAEWAAIENKIASVDQNGIIQRQKEFEKDIIKNLDICMKNFDKKINEKVNEIDQVAKKREEILRTDRFSYTLDRVLKVLENHGCSTDSYLMSILKYTSKYCEMKEKHEGYAEWCKLREQGLSERATKKTDNTVWR